MMRLPLRSFFWFALMLSAALTAACGSPETPQLDGDTCTCDAGMECVEGECVCQATGCCLTSADCMAGETCNQDLHRCEERVIPDGDNDQADGDTPVDGDEDGDTEPDGDTTDGDNTDGDTPDGDTIIDGDLDGDTVDGDEPDGDEPLDCMWGVDKLLHPENLPFFENQVVTKQFSSRDPNDGNTGNDDTITKYLYLENGSDSVLLDSRVPGCLYRVWMGEKSGVSDDVENLRVKFYFNNESTPTINMMVKNFFASNVDEEPVSPFLRPLVGNVSEGYYNYVPICWAESVKMTISGVTAGWQVTFQEMPGCTNIETFSLDMDVSELVAAVTENLGQDPKPTQGNTPTTYNTQIASGSIVTLFEDHIAEGNPGKSINSFKMDIAGVNEDILNSTWIEIFWDGKDVLSEPDVEVPIGLFFGSGFGEVDWSGVMMGMSTSESYYSYWPMPYWESAIIRLNNRSSSNIQQVNVEFQIGVANYPKNIAGQFRAVYNEEVPTSSNIDYTALDLGGKGRVVGIHLALQEYNQNQNLYLHGDERFYIDGMEFPIIRGTGTDNYFSGNKLWRGGSYSKPWFSLWKDPSYKYTARRALIGDSIPYNQSISLGFEHGKINTDNGIYRSVVFFYSSCLEGMQLTDEVCLANIDLTTPCSEPNHSFASELDDDLAFRNVTGAYEGEHYQTTSMDSGRGIQTIGANHGTFTLVLSLDSNNQGVRLVRKYSYKTKTSFFSSPQAATVLVGNADLTGQFTPVGVWLNPEQNTQLAWAESTFDIPAEYTQGKSAIGIKFEHTGEGTWWNMFHLWVYSILPPGEEGEGPGQVESLDYQMVGLKPCLSWSQPQGVPPTLYHIYRSSAQAFGCEQENFVGSTNDNEWCEPDALPAQSTFYYRVVAEDCTGTRGLCSDKFEIETGVPPTCYEAEATFDDDPEHSTTPDVFYSERVGTEFSGNKLVDFLSAAAGNRANFILDIEPDSASYMIEVTFLKGPNMATIDFLVGSATFSGTTNIDLYSPTDQLETMTFGPRNITGGAKYFTFRVGIDAVQNPASAGKHMAIDQICLLGVSSKMKAK
jgi:hypothetical protein